MSDENMRQGHERNEKSIQISPDLLEELESVLEEAGRCCGCGCCCTDGYHQEAKAALSSLEAQKQANQGR